MSRETWYVMEDGSFGDPAEILPGADGMLAHRDGRRVAYGAHGPRSRGVDAAAERAKKAKPAPAPQPKQTEARDLKADRPKRGYETRDVKAD